MHQGLRTAVYRVDDLERAKDWYGRAFGIEPYFDQPFYVGFRVGASELGLDPDLSEGRPGPGGSVAYWGVSGIEEAFDRLINLGGSAIDVVHEVGGGIKVAVVADPFGNLVGLIEGPEAGVTG